MSLESIRTCYFEAEDLHPASIASSSDLSFADTAGGKKLPSKKEKLNGSVKLKKSIAKKTKPKDAESNGITLA